ncbi:hypothetical protein [Candidatus Aalborgicola defluviihabitans]
MRDEPNVHQTYRLNGKDAAKRYDRKHLALKMLQVIQKIETK